MRERQRETEKERERELKGEMEMMLKDCVILLKTTLFSPLTDTTDISLSALLLGVSRRRVFSGGVCKGETQREQVLKSNKRKEKKGKEEQRTHRQGRAVRDAGHRFIFLFSALFLSSRLYSSFSSPCVMT